MDPTRLSQPNQPDEWQRLCKMTPDLRPMKILAVTYDVFDLLVVGRTLKLDLQMIETDGKSRGWGLGGPTFARPSWPLFFNEN